MDRGQKDGLQAKMLYGRTQASELAMFLLR